MARIDVTSFDFYNRYLAKKGRKCEKASGDDTLRQTRVCNRFSPLSLIVPRLQLDSIAESRQSVPNFLLLSKRLHLRITISGHQRHPFTRIQFAHILFAPAPIAFRDAYESGPFEDPSENDIEIGLTVDDSAQTHLLESVHEENAI
jgi:hypothetical protein